MNFADVFISVCRVCFIQNNSTLRSYLTINTQRSTDSITLNLTSVNTHSTHFHSTHTPHISTAQELTHTHTHTHTPQHRNSHKHTHTHTQTHTPPPRRHKTSHQ